MGITHVKGKKSASIMLYALSTCGWCKKTKRLLNQMGVEYDYIDVDILKGAEQDKVMKELEKWNSKGSFPTIIINDKAIVGFDEKEIKGAVGHE